MSEEARDDEINLVEFLRQLLATRTHVAIAVLAVTALFWLFVVLVNFASPTVQSSSINVFLTFEGAGNGAYPNGRNFSVNDLISPVVLNGVYDENNVAEYMTRQDFLSGFTATPYAPYTEVIKRKYAMQLENDKQTPADIDRLQQDLSNELNQATSQGATVTFSTSRNVAPELTSQLLRSVPEVWADHMINKLGVLRFDRKIYSAKAIDQELVKSMDYLISFEFLQDKLALLNQNIAEILVMPNGRLVRDEESGLSAPDLSLAASDLDLYRILPIITPIRKLGIAREPAVVKIYFEHKLLEHERARRLASRRGSNLESAYLQYDTQQPTRDQSGVSGGIMQPGGGMIPQIGSEFLDKIVEMTSAGIDTRFRQQLTERQIELANEVSRIEIEIKRVQEILTSLGHSDSGQTELRALYTKRADEEIPLVIDRLSNYFDVSNRLHEQLSHTSLGNTGSLFQFSDGEIEEASTGAILSIPNFRLYLILLFVAGVCVVPLSMSWRALRRA